MTKLTRSEITKSMAFIKHNQGCEGFILTEEDFKNAYDVLSGTRTADDIVLDLINKYAR